MGKECSSCSERLASSSFSKDRTKDDGLRTTCRQCKAATDRRYRAAIRERPVELELDRVKELFTLNDSGELVRRKWEC